MRRMLPNCSSKPGGTDYLSSDPILNRVAERVGNLLLPLEKKSRPRLQP